MAGHKQLNVIFDIDETIISYMDVSDFEDFSEEKQDMYHRVADTPKRFYLVRPHVPKIFDFVMDNCATLNLWTKSSKEYADKLVTGLRKINPRWKFANVWSEKDNEKSEEEHGCSKDLNYLWYTLGKFQPCDTVLIDDLKTNVANECNFHNGIHIPEFDPYKEGTEDTVLLKVIDKLKEVIAKSDFCKSGDLPFPFPNATQNSVTRVGFSGGRKTRRHRKVKKTRRRKA
jgi:hypothetical protein